MCHLHSSLIPNLGELQQEEQQLHLVASAEHNVWLQQVTENRKYLNIDEKHIERYVEAEQRPHDLHGCHGTAV